MAAADYLRAASAELRKAAQDLNQQVRTAQAEFDHQRRDLEGAIRSNEIDIRTKEASLAAMDDPVDLKGTRVKIAALLKVTQDHKQQLDAARGNVDGMASAKQAFASQLESLAGQLDSMAGRPEAG